MKSTRRLFVWMAVIGLVLMAGLSRVWPAAGWLIVVVGPLIAVGTYDMLQRRRTILRIYPLIGHFRFLLESIRPEIQQYFVESDINGRPVSREFRSLVYQRAKGVQDTRAFGTQFDVYRVGYEFMNHSLAPKPVAKEIPRVIFGGADCSQPYSASYLNISAMSYGALSRNAIMALNLGARKGGFFHCTGEGGLSPHHLVHGGDLVWQIGTGYFGCRDTDGQFDPERFAEKAVGESVKMIEIKLSQGAKPSHGGILPAAKLTEEIAAIRHVSLGHDVVSPPAHRAFSTPTGLLEFVARLRHLSGGKPVGFKLCVGRRTEFLSICKAMIETGIQPDFITVDGGEGGTGAAPIELTNSAGMPMRDGLSLVDNALRGVALRDQIRLVAAGKVMSAFHLLRVLALGADTVNAARAMMFALGCIQALQCNANTCPTGVTTQDPERYRALDVADKGQRVANYHQATVHGLMELVAAAGLEDPHQIQAHHVMRRVDAGVIKHFGELYPQIPEGSLTGHGPELWRDDWARASPDQWPEVCCR